MCAIVDANTAREVFSRDRPPAGDRFLNWLNNGSGRLVAGGKLLRELEKLNDFRVWASVAVNFGKIRILDDVDVDARTELIKRKRIVSDDPHVLAVAQIGGARLLYSNDKDLHSDFKNRKLIGNPSGSIYSTLGTRKFTKSHRLLLGRKDICLS